MAWKYILFDLDGTVTDSKEGICNSVKYALEAAKRPIPTEEELEEALQATETYRERYSVTGLYENRLYKGMDQVLSTLQKAGYQLAIATSKPEEYSVRILEHFGIARYFDEIVGSTLDGGRNAKADVICEVFRRMNIQEEEKDTVIMVGDRKHDILGAKECGIASCGVCYGFAPAGELEEYGADYLVYRVEELLSFFAQDN